MPPRKSKGKEVDTSEGNDMLGPVTAVANAAQKAGLIKDLLGPSAKVLGNHWGKRTQEYVDGLEARRQKNVTEHYERVKKVGKVEPPRNGPTERQFTAILEWTHQAQTVDPEEEPELAAMWQSLLSDIYKNDPYSEEIQAVLKNMTRGDARTFLNLHPWHSRPIPSPYFERFKQWGLVETRLRSNQIAQMSAMGILAIMIALIGQSAPGIMPFADAFAALMPVVSIMFGGFIAAALVVMAVRDLNRVRMTPLGEHLFTSGRRYLQQAAETNVQGDTQVRG